MFMLRPLSRTFKRSRGFTLLEALIAISVMSFAIFVIFYAFQSSMRIFTGEISEADVSVEVHRATERMVKELRNSLQIVSGGSTDITFWYEDTNRNGTREAGETVVFNWTGITTETVTRTIGSSSQIIANNIIRFSLTYDNPSDIKLIKIVITGQKGDSVSTLESSARSRNL